MYRSNTSYIGKTLFLQPSEIFVCCPSYITAGVWVKASCDKFLCNLLKLSCQLLPCSPKCTRQRINSFGADIADKTVNLTFGPFVMFLLHIALEIFVINFARIVIDDSLVKIYQTCVQVSPGHNLCPPYQQEPRGKAIPGLRQSCLIAFQQSLNRRILF